MHASGVIHYPDFVEPVPDIAAQQPNFFKNGRPQGAFKTPRLELHQLLAGGMPATTRFQVPALRSSARDNRETSAAAGRSNPLANSCAAPATVIERGRATMPLGLTAREGGASNLESP
jgi:hypothetical protein